MFSRGYDLPSSSDYEYSPRKPKAQDPPITPHEFQMVLSVCTENCPLRYIHRCRLGSKATLGLSKIPKRLKEWEYKAATPDNELAWGLEACHKICALRVLMYNTLLLIVPYGFWAYWQGVHPKDMQNASVPTTVAVSMITLFWTLSGIIQVLWEPLSSKT